MASMGSKPFRSPRTAQESQDLLGENAVDWEVPFLAS